MLHRGGYPIFQGIQRAGTTERVPPCWLLSRSSHHHLCCTSSFFMVIHVGIWVGRRLLFILIVGVLMRIIRDLLSRHGLHRHHPALVWHWHHPLHWHALKWHHPLHWHDGHLHAWKLQWHHPLHWHACWKWQCWPSLPPFPMIAGHGQVLSRHTAHGRFVGNG